MALKNVYVVEIEVGPLGWHYRGTYSIKAWAMSRARELAAEGHYRVRVERHNLDKPDNWPVRVYDSAKEGTDEREAHANEGAPEEDDTRREAQPR